jgi:hypothetical protein
MAFKPNYNQQRAERTRAKQAKKDEKLRLRQEQVAQRRASLDSPDSNDEGPTDDGA